MDEDGKSERNYYPWTFGCPICGGEFVYLSSVFDHMSKMHNSKIHRNNEVSVSGRNQR